LGLSPFAGLGQLAQCGRRRSRPSGPPTCRHAPPFYIHRYDNTSYHLSYMDDRGYERLRDHAKIGKTRMNVGWPRDYAALPIIRRYSFAPHVSHRDGKMPVELIGPVHAPGGSAPSNGMYALQKALRKRIDEGLDWLSIKPLPVSRGALAWFWHWDDRRYAAWWDSEGQPFVQGPNMIAASNSSRPPGALGPARTWPMTTTARWRCKKSRWPAAQLSEFAPGLPSSSTD
jgi:hypothetical protein